MIDSKYQIESSDHLCKLCSEQIPDGGSYFSAVVWADERFGRRNFCPSCWSRAGASDGEAASTPSRGADSATDAASSPPGSVATPSNGAERIDYFAYWLTRRPLTSDAPRERVRFDADVVLEFFRRLGADAPEDREDDDPGRSGDGGATASTLAGSDDDEENGSDDDDGSPADPPLPVPASSELGTRQRHELRFVLGLLLMRKKVLDFASSAVDDGREWLRLVERASGRVHWVENPVLSDDELTRVRDAIGELLQMRV